MRATEGQHAHHGSRTASQEDFALLFPKFSFGRRDDYHINTPHRMSLNVKLLLSGPLDRGCQSFKFRSAWFG
nr:hypothetical protein SHINE37_90037 [Rhizobiaceae bacterium]